MHNRVGSSEACRQGFLLCRDVHQTRIKFRAKLPTTTKPTRDLHTELRVSLLEKRFRTLSFWGHIVLRSAWVH
jgi:hypothetical protein